MKKEIIETGEILFLKFKLSGQDNSLYYLTTKEVRVTMIEMEKV